MGDIYIGDLAHSIDAGEEYFLAHYGIKGMKWGVRRYQNEDGSLTQAGKEKLEKWRDKEDRKIRKEQFKLESRAMRKADKANFEWTKAADEHGAFSPEALKKGAKAAKKEGKANYIEAYYKTLRERTANMTLNDIRQENVKVGKAFTKTIAASLAISSLMVPTIGYGTAIIPNTTAIRRNSRVSSAERKTMREEAYRNASEEMERIHADTRR